MRAKKHSDYLALTNEELTFLSQNGDEIAFNTLAGRFLNTRYIKSNGTYLDTDDFIQEGMFGFLNAVRTYDPEKKVPFEAYASICMRNSMNSAAVNLPKEIAVDNSSDALINIEGAEDPLKYILTSEHLSEVLDACEVSLTEIEKTVVFFRASGMSYKEIGEKLGMSAKAVDNAVQRARRKLKQVLIGND